MKFGKTYTEYIERESHSQLLGCSYVEFKRLKKVLKSCPFHHVQCRQAHLPIPSSSLGDHRLLSNGPHDDEPLADGVPPPTTQEVSLSCPGSCYSWIVASCPVATSISLPPGALEFIVTNVVVYLARQAVLKSI